MKGVTRSGLGVVLCLMVTTPALSSLQRFSPTDDSFVFSSVPTFYYGAYTNLLVSKAFGGDGKLTGERQSYLKFNLTRLANMAPADVLSVTLYLYVTTTAGGVVEAYHSADTYHNSSDPWIQAGINWGNKPMLGTSRMGTSEVLSPNSTYKTINLLAEDTSWLANDLGDHYLSVALLLPSGVTSSTAYYFNSIEANPAYHTQPYMEILLKEYTLTLEGSGGGTITSNPPGISCPSSCSSTFDGGTAVTLTATADSNSVLSGWSEASCPGSGDCQVTMDSNKTVTGTFVLKPVRITTPSPSYYSTLGGAYAQASDGNILQSREYTFNEDLDLNSNISLTLEGGYDVNYGANSGYTSLHGTLKISNGTLVLENLIIL
jgi:hypothetical protein